MTIYLIQNLDSTNVKIGFTSRDPLKRLRALQTACDGQLRLLVTYDGDITREEEVHWACRQYKIRNEWFTKDCIERCERFFRCNDTVGVYPDAYLVEDETQRQYELEILRIEYENKHLKMTNGNLRAKLEENNKTIESLCKDIGYYKTLSKYHMEDAKFWRSSTNLALSTIEKRSNSVKSVAVQIVQTTPRKKHKTINQVS